MAATVKGKSGAKRSAANPGATMPHPRYRDWVQDLAVFAPNWWTMFTIEEATVVTWTSGFA